LLRALADRRSRYSAPTPPELGADLSGVEGIAGVEVCTGLPQVGERLFIAEDVKGL
jgi:hypothetical protein